VLAWERAWDMLVIQDISLSIDNQQWAVLRKLFQQCRQQTQHPAARAAGVSEAAGASGAAGALDARDKVVPKCDSDADKEVCSEPRMAIRVLHVEIRMPISQIAERSCFG
jgi:hypothetical protein